MSPTPGKKYVVSLAVSFDDKGDATWFPSITLEDGTRVEGKGFGHHPEDAFWYFASASANLIWTDLLNKAKAEPVSA